MTESSKPHNLAPAGYLVLQKPEEARLTSEYRRGFGLYAGVDRLPTLFPPDATIRQAIGEAPVQDVRLATVIDEWLDSRFGNTAFIANRSQAFQFLKAFQGFGFRFELVFCQLAWTAGEEDRLNAYGTTNETPPVVSQTIGFDVSWPTCNHSAILQPGVVASNLLWRAKLNQYGLLKEYEDATKLRDEYLMIYPYPPFDIYLVHRIEPNY